MACRLSDARSTSAGTCSSLKLLVEFPDIYKRVIGPNSEYVDCRLIFVDRTYDRTSLEAFSESVGAKEVGFLLKHVDQWTGNPKCRSAWRRFYKDSVPELSKRVYQERNWLHHRNYLGLFAGQLREACRIILADMVSFADGCRDSEYWSTGRYREQWTTLDCELANSLDMAIKHHLANVRRLAAAYNHMYPNPDRTDSEEECLEKLGTLVHELVHGPIKEDGKLKGASRYEKPNLESAFVRCVDHAHTACFTVLPGTRLSPFTAELA